MIEIINMDVVNKYDGEYEKELLKDLDKKYEKYLTKYHNSVRPEFMAIFRAFIEEVKKGEL